MQEDAVCPAVQRAAPTRCPHWPRTGQSRAAHMPRYTPGPLTVFPRTAVGGGEWPPMVPGDDVTLHSLSVEVGASPYNAMVSDFREGGRFLLLLAERTKVPDGWFVPFLWWLSGLNAPVAARGAPRGLVTGRLPSAAWCMSWGNPTLSISAFCLDTAPSLSTSMQVATRSPSVAASSASHPLYSLGH